MLKYSLILLGAYFLYYAGNIVYDLFLKKQKSVQTDESEEFSLADLGQTDGQAVSRIEIEDVENIKTPKSYLKRELHPAENPNSFEENPDLEKLRRRFEAEQDIDEILPVQNETKTDNDKSDTAYDSSNIMSESAENSKMEESPSKKNYWKELLNLSETTVQLVANYDGQKVYHSTI